MELSENFTQFINFILVLLKSQFPIRQKRPLISSEALNFFIHIVIDKTLLVHYSHILEIFFNIYPLFATTRIV